MLYKKHTTHGITTTNPFNLWWYLEISDGLCLYGLSETCDPGLERLRYFMALTVHQWSGGPQLQFRLQCSRGRSKKGDKGKKRGRKLEMGMESSCARPEAVTQPQQNIYHRAVLRGQHCPNSPGRPASSHSKLLESSRIQLETYSKPEHLTLPSFSVYKCLFS